ncbi:hypothetical protein C2W62_18500 [Candidatus Entotheonella serta]|nr:hypothetical protein C2W62_18500 [Candidatus Entotheonella serta]
MGYAAIEPEVRQFTSAAAQLENNLPAWRDRFGHGVTRSDHGAEACQRVGRGLADLRNQPVLLPFFMIYVYD